MNTYYPQIDLDQLLPIKVVLTSISDDPLWLERPECPYDKDTREALWTMWLTFRAKPSKKTETISVVKTDEDKWTDVANELNTLFEDLKNAASETEALPDLKEKLNYFRVATSLIEKIVGLGERASNVREVSAFQAKVLAVFDEVLTPEQRTRAMEKLSQ